MEATTTGGSSEQNRPEGQQIVDGSEIMRLVGNEEVFSSFVDHKFKELDKDQDGQLSVEELQPAVADIGAALGLPTKGTSPDSDHIYSEVLNEFTHGKGDTVSKSEFKEVLSDILLGMAAGLKRDPVVILRIDGEDLKEFIIGPGYESEMVSIYSQIDLPQGSSVKDYTVKALEKLGVDRGMPPSTDPWVVSNVVEPVLECDVDQLEKPMCDQVAFLEVFEKVAERLIQRLKEQPVIVAHTENTFDGSAIRRLLSNKFELDKAGRVGFTRERENFIHSLLGSFVIIVPLLSWMQTLNSALENVPKDRHGKVSKEYLRVVLDAVAPSAGLPPLGAIDQMDRVVEEAFRMVDADDGKVVKEEEFKNILTEILGSLMLQLEGNPISVSSNSVVHEPLALAPSVLQMSS